MTPAVLRCPDGAVQPVPKAGCCVPDNRNRRCAIQWCPYYFKFATVKLEGYQNDNMIPEIPGGLEIGVLLIFYHFYSG